MINQDEKLIEGETYLNLWKALNRTNVESIEEENIDYPTGLNYGKVLKFFNQNSHYKIISLKSLSEEDKQFLASVGLSVKHLTLNCESLITENGTFQKQYRNLEEQLKLSEVSEKQRQRLSQLSQQLDFQLSMIEKGYIYAICPYTGKVLKSNRSFPYLGIHDSVSGCCYRFIGNEVFYLIVDVFGSLFVKGYLYFPSQELLISLFGFYNKPLHLLNKCKAFLVTHWPETVSYILRSENDVKTVTIIGNPSIAHYALNYLSGLQRLYENELLCKVDRILSIEPEFYGGIDEIFPEIHSEKIERIQHPQVMLKKILENNYFALQVTNDTLRRSGIHDKAIKERLLQLSYKKCSYNFLQEVEITKKRHFPLLWITTRLHKRVWLSQVEGLANIIKEMYIKFPNLGVVFDGYSRQDVGGNLVGHIKEEEIINQEKELVTKIQSVIPQEIQVYNNIGCFMHESLIWAKAIDLYFIPGGSSVTKVLIFDKNGICHSSHTVIDWMSTWMNQPLQFLSKYHITEVNEGKLETNYDFDWKIAYEELLKIALVIKRER